MARTVITNGLIVTMDAERRVYSSGYLIYQGGVLVELGSGAPTTANEDQVVDARGCAVLPGFVNTHHHLAATMIRGMTPDRSLGIAADQRTPTMRLHAALDEEECYLGALLGLAELTRSGVTTTTDSQALWTGMRKADGSLRAAHESGLRVIYSAAFMDRTEMVPSDRHFTINQAVAEFDRLQEAWTSTNVQIIPEVMSLPRGSDELITALHAAGDGRMAMHLTYSPEFATWAQGEYGHSAIEHLDSLGVLHSGFLGAHPIYLNEVEQRLYGTSGAAAAYCAVSNMLIGVGNLPFHQLRAYGAAIGLGLDYPNHSHNFFETIKMSLLAQKQDALDGTLGSPFDALAWATIDGARALGLEDTIGSLEVGKQADLQIIDLQRTHLWPPLGAINLLVLGGSPDAVRDVAIGGRWMLRNRELTQIDEPALLTASTRAQEHLAAKADVPGKLVVPREWNLID